MPRRLTKEAEERIESFKLEYGRHSSCGCGHPNAHPPCGWCTDPDNPHNIEEDDDSYETFLTLAAIGHHLSLAGRTSTNGVV